MLQIMEATTMKMRQSAFVLAWIGLLLGVVLVGLQPARADVSAGLIAYYPFNGNANDETGNGHDGTVDGATLSTDRFDNPLSAYSFDGSNDKILIGQAPNNFPNLEAYAVSVWFLNNGEGDQGQGYGQKILSKGDFGTDFHLSVGPDGGNPDGYLSWWSDQGGFASVTDTSRDYRDNVWHHVVLNKKTASEGELWVDGVLQASSSSLAKVDNNVDLVIGFTAHTDGFQQKYWSGKIDDIRIYNRVLSASEILALFELPPDQDGDDTPDSEDACPSSDLRPTVSIDGCDTGVANPSLPTGCTL
ncbi:MAG TPA: LamG domain-containing protein, partial [Candidatus Tectomicrobia bacterium]